MSKCNFSNNLRLFSLISFAVNGFISPSQDKTPAPDPQIKIVIHPPNNVIISSNSSILLACSAEYTDNKEDWLYMDDDGALLIGDNIEELTSSEQNDDSDMHQDQNHSSKHDISPCQSDTVLYQWLHNDELINTNSSLIYQTFCNGTLKIAHSSAAIGMYRCIASTRKPDVGAVSSKSSNVQIAGKT